MVCGTMFAGGNVAMPAPGTWSIAENKGVSTDAQQVWPFPIYAGVQCFGPWMEPMQHPVLPLAIPEVTMLQPEADRCSENLDTVSVHSGETVSVHSAESAPSTSGEPQRKQSAARAAKRQRGRERRKMFRAAAQAGNQINSETSLATLTQKFDGRAAAVSAEVKLVVNRTFFDVCEEDEMSDDNVAPLPAPFFETTREIDQYRREYRRFRLGYHQGAKCESISKLPCVEEAILGLDGKCGAPIHYMPIAAMGA
jgi:hypothetical protein